MRRVAAIALRSLLVDLARLRSPETAASPLAVVLTQQQDRDERSVLGNTRISAVSPEAVELGVRPGMTVAAARARSADLRVRVVHAARVKQTLCAIAEACLAFGATTATSLGARWSDDELVWVDVTGCAHLHASSEIEGERVLAGLISARVAQLGHACRVAIASGPRIAAAVARFAPESPRALVIPPKKNREALHRLPIAALPMSAATTQWLESLGLGLIRDLANVPRASLGARLGRECADVMLLIDGDDRAPLCAYVPEVSPTESLSLEYAIERAEQIVFVAKALCDRIGARLEGRGEGALLLVLTLTYDRAFVTGDARTASFPVVLPSPLCRAADLLSVLRTRIDALGHQALVRAPIAQVALTAAQVVVRALSTAAMFEPEAKAVRALPRLCAELVAELGDGCVGTLAVADSWRITERTVLLPFGAPRPRELRRLHATGAEPLRLARTPRPADVQAYELVLRSESIEWWKPGKHADCTEWATAWVVPTGARAMLRMSSNETLIVGWMD